ncbi:death-associated protein kinase 1-like [Ptychodera flava]|uniref:death-associated protein kinase 1-like n=1 Tax=Ptychodera flava TaxID=63121 RepID=UPI003969D2E0
MNHIKKLDPLLDEDFIKLSTNYLQDMGEILIIKSEKSTISDTIILRPQWLCANVFGPMLATEIFVQYSNRLQRKKVHSKQDLTDVFQQYANTDMLLHLLEKFELLFEVEPPSGGVVQENGPRMFYIIPSLLDYQMPDEQWQREGSKQIYYGRRFQCRDETDSFSPGLFPRLQTRLHRYFTEIGCPPSGIWKNGIKVCDEVEGLVYMTKDWKAIHICVRAEREDEIGECYEMLEKISEDTHGLLEISCPGSNIDCHILSAHSMKNHHRQEYVKYYTTEKILEAEKGKKRVFDEELGTAENVFDLLCCGYDTTMLHRQGYLSDVRWMLHDTRVEFTTAMDVHQETGNDYRLMADLMGIRYKEVKAWESRATSVTERILTEWSTRWMNRTKKRRPPSRANIFYESSFLNLIAVLREPSMQREDAAHLLREMFNKIGVAADERAQVEDGESVILEDNEEEEEDSDASE